MLPDSRFLNDIHAGKLPPMTFYKPQGSVNEHAVYANIADGDRHIATLLTALRASPQWSHMLVVVTYDEFGGWWDHAAPPKGDRFGPGTRIPALIVSPYARKGTVDHTSMIRLDPAVRDQPVEAAGAAGDRARDAALAANGLPAMGI